MPWRSARRTIAPENQGNSNGLPRRRSTVIDAVIVSTRSESMADLCRRLRLDNRTWDIPILACSPEPDRAGIIAAMEAGASHVLALPAEEVEILRVLSLAESGGA